MITPELEAHILRLFQAEKWKPGTISTQLHVHRDTVLRVLSQAGVPRPALVRSSQIDPFVAFIEETLERYPTLPASRLFEMCRERGYKGNGDHFRHRIACLRPRRPAEAFLRLKTLPGEQAQVDWGHFGSLAVGRAMRLLLGFVMVLSFSRRLFLRFFLGGHTANFLHGHEQAFQAFGGVPRCILYDNLKSAVLERVGDAIRFNPLLLQFAAHYHYEPRPVAIARGNEKGRVERAIAYIRRSFFLGRRYTDLADLNRQAHDFCEGPAMDRRCPEDEQLTVRDAFISEQSHLLALPDNPFPVEERVEVSVGKTPYARFDLNDYSVPHDKVRRVLIVRASLETVRIFDDAQQVATHARCYDRRQRIEDPSHIEALILAKARASEQRGHSYLQQAAPSSQQLLIRLSERGEVLGREVKQLLRLLEEHGAEALEAAIREALQKDVPHHHAVRHILERERRARGEPPPLSVKLPDDPRVRDLTVTPHELQSYDALIPKADATPEEDDHERR